MDSSDDKKDLDIYYLNRMSDTNSYDNTSQVATLDEYEYELQDRIFYDDTSQDATLDEFELQEIILDEFELQEIIFDDTFTQDATLDEYELQESKKLCKKVKI